MSKREYTVITIRNRNTRLLESFEIKYCSDDDDDRLAHIPSVVTFPVNDVYDQDLQEKRVLEYANYLNKLDEAAKIAYDQIHLVDVLKR
jgi:hypothetical protein